MQDRNMVGWFEIYVENMPRAKKFYEAVFDVKLEPLPSPAVGEQLSEMLVFPQNMTNYGSGGALVKMEGFDSGKNSVIIYFSSDDCEVEESRVIPNGGSILQSKFSIGEYGHITHFKDTEGNIIGLHSMN